MKSTRKELLDEIQGLRLRLKEAEEALSRRLTDCITEQRQSEIALRESEERFRVAQELSPDGFLILRPERDARGHIEDFTWVYGNATIARLVGQDPQAVVGRRLLELLPSHAQSSFHDAYIRVANTGEPCVLEASYHGDSIRSITWFRVAVVPIGRDIAVLAQDITARKQGEEEIHQQSEAALRLSEQEFRSLAEAMPQIVWATRPDGWNIYFNQQWVEYTGLTMEESYGHGWNTPFHPDDQERAWDAWQRATQNNERYSLECRLRRADGVYRWWLVRGEPMRGANGEIVKWFGTCTDIEDLKHAEAELLKSNYLLEQRVAERTSELSESEHQFRVLIENLQSAVALIDRSGEFTIVNRAFFRMFELDDNSTIKNVNDRDWSQWRVFDEKGSLLDVDEHPVRKAALTGKPVRDMLVAVEAPDNPALKWLLVSTEPIMDAQGHIHLIICTYHDITKRKHAEEALETMNEKLEERVAQRTAELREKDQMLLVQSRQAAMGEMIGNIAHQWRQPLNTLGLSIQQLEFYYEAGEFTKELLAGSVVKSMGLIEHMSRTIDDFRNYFKPDKDKAEFKVSDALRSTLSLIKDTFKAKHITVESSATCDPVIYGYQNEFSQVLLNILNNAGDVLTERQSVDPKVTIRLDGAGGGHSIVTIADNAGGIPEEIIGKVFDPYFSTKGPQQGTGIGLYMSKTIIEKNMGGTLTVKNVAEGAEFRIEV
jgi:PAS domain S-box-containing protein